MRLVFVIVGLAVGGAETFLLRLTERLSPDFQIHVISLSSDGPVGAKLRARGVPVTVMGMKPGRFSVLQFFRLVALLRALRPDVVQTWMYHADLIGGVAARFAGISAVIWSIRHTDLSLRANKRSTLMVAKLCAWLSHLVPRRIVINAQAARVSHVAYGYAADAMTVIPNGLDLDRFHPDIAARVALRAELQLANEALLVGCIGRFDPQKGQDVFLDAAALIVARLPRVRFLLAGRGIEVGNAELWSSVVRHNLEEKVFLLGPRDDVACLMAALDLLVLPSVGEGFPNVVVEAMAAGTPCVVTEAGDAAMIVGETGLARPVGDAAGLAEGAVVLLSLPPPDRVALSARARARVAENFEIGAVTRRYETLYRDVAGGT